ncbi:MAG TPA: FGGY family carbohydrate kinase [Anaeromyxobacter sp.]|nr:FGGY family carbohydrate kinase [Anaeromyxobacter sp.]
MALVLSADVGTSSLKAVLFDGELRALAQARCEYPTRYPGYACAEQDPEDWYRALGRVVREVLEAGPFPPSDIVAVGVDGMSSLALPVDAAGRALRPAMIWIDRRAEAEAEFIRLHHQELELKVNGNRPDPSSFAPKMMWIRDHEPEVYRAAASFLHCNGYLVQRLTGAFGMDVSEAGLSLLCELESGDWSEELVRECRLDRRKLPPVLRCTEVAGKVTRAAAAETGLAAGTPVVAGAMDNVAATLGLGLRDDGDAYISAGTATNVGLLLDRPVFDGKGLVYHSGIEGRWLKNGGADYGGAGLLWFRNLLEDTDLKALGELGSGVPCGEHPLVFLPYMVGQRAPLWNDRASGVLLGVRPGTERRHLARAFMESVALGARHAFEALCGRRPEGAALTGGITHNAAWTQLFADATGMRLFVGGQAEVTTLGTAILAGMGVGLFRDLGEALALLPPASERVPAGPSARYYDELYGVFASAYSGLKESLEALDRLRKRSGSPVGAGSRGEGLK